MRFINLKTQAETKSPQAIKSFPERSVPTVGNTVFGMESQITASMTAGVVQWQNLSLPS